MTLPLAYRREVRGDIDETFAWYEQRQSGLGERFLKALGKVVESIEANPEMYGKVYRDARAATLHRFPYVVYYRIEATRTLVLAVQHGSRDPQQWQKRNGSYPPESDS